MNRAPTLSKSSPAFLGVALLSLILFTNLTARTILSPLLPVIERDLSISHTAAGSFFLLISVGYCLTMFVSGFVSQRLQHRGTILLSTFLTGGALFILASSSSLLEIRLSLALLGMAIGLYFASGMATIADLVDRRSLGQAMAIHEAGPALSFVVAPLIATGLLQVMTWRGAVVCAGAAAIFVAFLFLFIGRGGRIRGAPPHLENLRSILSLRSFWIIAMTACMAAGCAIGVYSVLPLFLSAEIGMDVEDANKLLSLSRVPSVFAVLLTGWLIDRFGSRTLMLGIGIVVGAATVALGLCQGSALVVAIFIQPMLVSSFFPAAFAGLASIVPRDVYNVAVSSIVPFIFLFGGGIVPTFMGVLGDRASFALGFVLLGSCLLASLVLLPFLRIPKDGE